MKQRMLLCLALCLFLLTSVWSPAIAVTTDAKPITVEYALPYPGILPDHPLYALKRLRDYILERVIVEPVRKAEFYILQGDKRLQMGISLIDQQKFALAETTISKAEKYLEKSLQDLSAYQSIGNAIPGYVVERLTKSLAKHEEIIRELMGKLPDVQQAGLSASLQLTNMLQSEITKLK